MVRRESPLGGVDEATLGDPDVQDWMQQGRMRGLMKHDAARKTRHSTSGPLRVPKKGEPLSEIPEVLKGVTR